MVSPNPSIERTVPPRAFGCVSKVLCGGVAAAKICVRRMPDLRARLRGTRFARLDNTVYAPLWLVLVVAVFDCTWALRLTTR